MNDEIIIGIPGMCPQRNNGFLVDYPFLNVKFTILHPNKKIRTHTQKERVCLFQNSDSMGQKGRVASGIEIE